MTAIIDSVDSRRWLPFGVPAAGLRLYCLPHAGGSASAFRSWAGQLGDVAVCPVQPPGRETRLRDTPHTRMETLVDELADVLSAESDGNPYALYGHSLGALVGFELAREMRRRGSPPPEHLIVSGCPVPDESAVDTDPQVAGMSPAEVVTMLRRLGGTPEWLLNDPAALQIILPPFTADFCLKQAYRYGEEAPLDIPVTAIASTGDPRAGVEAMAAWHAHTSATFTWRTMPGGHFAVLEHPSTTLGFLAEALTPWSRLPSADRRPFALRNVG